MTIHSAEYECLLETAIVNNGPGSDYLLAFRDRMTNDDPKTLRFSGHTKYLPAEFSPNKKPFKDRNVQVLELTKINRDLWEIWIMGPEYPNFVEKITWNSYDRHGFVELHRAKS